MVQDLAEVGGLLLACDLEKLVLGGGDAMKEAQIDSAPVDVDHGAGAEPLGYSQSGLRAYVNAPIESAAAISVVPWRKHAADGQQRDVNSVIATNRVKDIVGRHIDIARVMHDDAALLQDVTDTDGLVTAFPAPAFVSGLDGDDVDASTVKMIAEQVDEMERLTEGLGK